MRRIRVPRIVPLLLVSVVADIAVASPPARVKKDAWSKAVNSLSGRLAVARAKISTSESFQLTLKLKNLGGLPIAVQAHNPHLFTVIILGGNGKQIPPSSQRLDVISSPQWGVIPREAHVGFPVSIKSTDGAKGSHIDITTSIWRLPPGKYRICGEYSSGAAAEFMGKPGKARIWEGKIRLPPVDVEITPDK